MDKNLEMLNRAKSYIENLALGNNPLTGEELPDDTVLNEVRISRCFFFVGEVLQKVIDNGGEINKKSIPRRKKLSFAITEEQKSNIHLSDQPLTISKFCEKINEQIDRDVMKRLKVTSFGTWLVDKGLLEIEIRNDKKYKKPTQAGRELGIVGDWSKFNGNDFYTISYTGSAQQFLLDNLDEIICISNGENNVE